MSEDNVEHEHQWGSLVQSRFAGTWHRKCQISGCKAISLDDDDVTEDHFIRVEYDLSYTGGDYSKAGESALIPENLVKEHEMKEAFRRHTSIDPIHIVHYSDEVVIFER